MQTSIYIAGPITGMKNNNREAFEKASAYLSSINYDVLSPINNEPRNPNGDPPTWADYLRMGIMQLMVCDEIYLLQGWEGSKGAQVELGLAKVLGMKEHYQVEEKKA